MNPFFARQTDVYGKRSAEFAAKAQAVLDQSDELYWTVVEDAISSIKITLQRYLYGRIAQGQPGAPHNEWNDVARNGGLPELLATCKTAGLELRGIDDQVRRLNDDRNRRVHDDPRLPVTRKQAEDAIGCAKSVQSKVAAALHIPLAPTNDISASKASGVPSDAKASEPIDASQGVSAAPERKRVVLSTSVGHTVPRRRALRIAKGVAYAAALAVVLAAGTVLGVDVEASGTSPSWLRPLTSRQGTATPVVTQAPGATSTVPVAPAVAGSIGILTVGCSSGAESIQLENMGETPIRWAIAAPGGGSVHVTLTPQNDGTTTLFGELQPGASVTVIARGAAAGTDIVVTSDDGAASMRAERC